MVKSIYITSAEGNAGKSTIALGVLDTLAHQLGKVGVFRPIARSTRERDYVLELLLSHADASLDYERCIGVSYDDVHADPDAALMTIVERYKAVERECDAMVIVGSDYTDIGRPTELGFNARIAANLGAPVLLVLGGQATDVTQGPTARSDARSPVDIARLAELSVDEIRGEHAGLLGIVANRVAPDRLEAAISAIRGIPQLAGGSRHPGVGDAAAQIPVWALPEDPFLVAPTVRGLMDATGGELIAGDPELLGREALTVLIAAMSMENVLPRLVEGSVVIVPGDRTEVLLTLLLANSAGTFPSLAGIVLNGGFEPSEQVGRLIEGLRSTLPIISTPLSTYDAAVAINRTRGRLAADSRRKQDTALRLFDEHVQRDILLELLDVDRSPVVTPLMFEYAIVERARSNRRHIVLPEGDDDRVLRAASTILARGIADLTILGEQFEVLSRAIELGIDVSRAQVLSPFDDVMRHKFAREYAKLRAGRGTSAPTIDQASDLVTDPAYFGTMMVHSGLADGMVSGAAHTTAHTVRPAYEILKTAPDVSVASGAILLALGDRVLVYADCAVVPEPTAEQLADIAVASVRTARQFGIEPRVAMLSYASVDPVFGVSTPAPDMQKVADATRMLRERMPDVPVDGPVPFDAVTGAAVASEAPPSGPQEQASVFVFPDLDSAATTYKAVERSGAVAIGPVLQGLSKPVNDLSRAATVDDIVNVVAITAVQAGR